ncbi:MAG TPA: flavin reductase family protein [bacterium]|mgnify:FL=1|nr:flavin reductase family protein [bacterium]HPQ66987.1 flavin reductase family protein [bacterium]
MKKSLGPQTIILPAPVLVVGTYNEDGRPNAMTAAWGGICCSRPPCLAVSLRKATVTWGNIIRRQAFTVSIPSAAHAAQADFFGLVSGRDRDKIAEAGLTAVRSGRVDAPYIEEFPLVISCRVLHSVVLGLHTQFVGEILDVACEETFLDGKDLPRVEAVDPICYAPGIREYYGLGKRLGEGYRLGRGLAGGSGEA